MTSPSETGGRRHATVDARHHEGLLAALRFYADRDSWQPLGGRDEFGQPRVRPAPAILDSGDVARAALEGRAQRSTLNSTSQSQ